MASDALVAQIAKFKIPRQNNPENGFTSLG